MPRQKLGRANNKVDVRVNVLFCFVFLSKNQFAKTKVERVSSRTVSEKLL